MKSLNVEYFFNESSYCSSKTEIVLFLLVSAEIFDEMMMYLSIIMSLNLNAENIQ